MQTKVILAIQLLLGFVWLKSALGKFASNIFITTLAPTLTKFASKNPLPWYKTFLEAVAIPNVTVFGELTRWGELTAATLLIGSVVLLFKRPSNKYVLIAAALGSALGFFLNLQFGLASFWMSPASETVNVVMGGTELILLVYYTRLRWFHPHSLNRG